MNEEPCWFGADEGLFGVVSKPPEGISRRRQGVILMNPGTLHRVGGARINVRLARQFAQLGYPSLRFDFSGLGDSAPREDGVTYLEGMIDELRAAADLLLDKQECTEVILVGHCTGAAMSFEMALHDERVAGAVLIEGYAYPTARFQAVRWLRHVSSWSNWHGLLSGRKDATPALRRLAGGVLGLVGTNGHASGNGHDSGIEDTRRRIRSLEDLLPPREHVRAGLEALIGRKVRLLQVYAGGEHHYYNYRSQFADAFPGLDFKGMVEVEYQREANHYFSTPAQQKWLDNRILRWLTSFSCWLFVNGAYWVPDLGMI